jgi:GMP synthase (glutamine-hydrolysing)
VSHLLVLSHGPGVGPDLLRSPLDGRAASLVWRQHDLVREPTVPRLTADVAGLVVLGGQMNTDDDETWLEPERALLREAVAAGVPTLGICLGAQQLGAALGGSVVHRPAGRHAAVSPLRRTEAGGSHDVVAGWPDGAPALFHHGDEVATLPRDAVPVLDGSDAAHPAWVDATDTALAVQFHPEASPATVNRWRGRVTGDQEGEIDEAFLADVEAAAPFTRAAGVGLVMRWVDTRVVPRA